MECTLGDQTVLAQVMTVVGGEDNQGILGDPQAFEAVENPAHFSINQADHAVITGQ
jgi:hypothetical protein